MWIARFAAALFLAAMPACAFAQANAGPVAVPHPALEKAPAAPAPADAAAPLSLLPGPGAPSSQAAERRRLTLEARLTEAGKPLKEGIVWRIFRALPGADGKLPLLVTQHGGVTAVELPSGDYFVHAAFGRAGATKRVSVGSADQTESLVLNAGGLRLDAVVGDQAPVAPERLSFEVLRANEDGEMVTVVPKAQPGRVLRLAAGTYHVISRYGTLNAVVRADITVEAGKLTEAVLRQSGAAVTLKLVASEGAEALANTSWSVVTDVGDTVHQAVGAFPSIILAEGSYTAVAKHDGQIYSRDFTVESGVDHDVEVRLSDRIEPDAEAPTMADAPALQARPRLTVRRAAPRIQPAAPAQPSVAGTPAEDTPAQSEAPADAGSGGGEAGTDAD